MRTPSVDQRSPPLFSGREPICYGIVQNAKNAFSVPRQRERKNERGIPMRERGRPVYRIAHPHEFTRAKTTPLLSEDRMRRKPLPHRRDHETVDLEIGLCQRCAISLPLLPYAQDKIFPHDRSCLARKSHSEGNDILYCVVTYRHMSTILPCRTENRNPSSPPNWGKEKARDIP